MIAINNLEFYYVAKELILNIPKLNITESSTTEAIDPDGIGKSTLLNLIAGYFLPQQGNVSNSMKIVSGF